jgi:uncharacterized membrane protein YhiD involved in acid resistance
MMAFRNQRKRTQAARVRTHALGALGASLLTVTTILYLHDAGEDGAGEVIYGAAGIVTGVGFIGAGTIMTSGGR